MRKIFDNNVAVCHIIFGDKIMPKSKNKIPEFARLSIRIPIHIKERIEQAAVVSGVSITDFTIRNLSESADEILEQQHFRKLSNRDRDIFLALLDNNDEPNGKLIEAFKARKELISE